MSLRTGRLSFQEMLRRMWAARRFVCVGIDSDTALVPYEAIPFGHSDIERVLKFNAEIVTATADVACAFKLNLAFYLACGSEGIDVLRQTVEFMNARFPDVPVILDAKDADTDRTMRQYDRFVFEHIGADAVTVSPYMGAAPLQALLARADKGVFVVCRTSNEGAEEFQERMVHLEPDEILERGYAADGPFADLLVPLYQLVAWRVSKHWNANGNCGLVVGATCPDALRAVREIAPDLPILEPGVGVQGANLEAAVTASRDANCQGIIMSASSSIIFASSERDFAEAARAVTYVYHIEVRRLLAK